MLTMTAHGRIGRDAELRHTERSAVLDIAIACNYGMKGDDGKKPTQWVKAVMWGKQAEALCGYLTKGKGVCVTLRDVNIKTFNKNDGSVGTSLEGTVTDFEFTGAGPREEAAAPAPPPARAPAPPPRAAAPAPASDGWDDDIPF